MLYYCSNNVESRLESAPAVVSERVKLRRQVEVNPWGCGCGCIHIINGIIRWYLRQVGPPKHSELKTARYIFMWKMFNRFVFNLSVALNSFNFVSSDVELNKCKIMLSESVSVVGELSGGRRLHVVVAAAAVRSVCTWGISCWNIFYVAIYFMTKDFVIK